MENRHKSNTIDHWGLKKPIAVKSIGKIVD